MKTEDVLQLRPLDRFGNWGLKVRGSVPTRDSRRLSRRTLDTLLSAVTEAEMAEYLAGQAKMDPGRVWDGYFKPMLDAMDSSTRDKLLRKLSDYGSSMETGSMRPGPNASLASVGDEPLGNARTNDGSLARCTLRQWRDANGKVCDTINEQNRKVYGKPFVAPVGHSRRASLRAARARR